MNKKQKEDLLLLARNSVTAAITGVEMSDYKCDDPQLEKHLGCFVTLKTRGELRGCLGVFQSDSPLFKTVVRMAAEAALEDPRFVMNRLSVEELPLLDIEISVLSELEKTDDPLSLEIGEHGIYITRGFASGCFLPQVATEAGWNKEEFLSYCCSHKAGLPADAWKEPETNVYLFTAEVFGEEEME